MRAIWLAVAVAGAGLVTACKDSQKPDENAAPVADFSFSCPALRCDFTDKSSDDSGVKGWIWTFGDDGSSQRNPIYNYPSAGTYPVSLTVTDGEGLSNTITKKVDPKAPAVTTLSCVDPTAPGGLVACTLKLDADAITVVLNSSSCDAHGNVFRIVSPAEATLTSDGCYEQQGKTITLTGPFRSGTEIHAEVIAPRLQNPPQLRVEDDYPAWHLMYEDGFDSDFNDLDITLTAITSGN